MKKNGKVLILEIIVIILAILGITLAITFVMNSIGITASSADLAVTYTGSNTLPSDSLFPISDSSVSSNTDNVLRVNFTVKGASTNPSNKDIIYDVILDDLNIPCTLKNEYFKWRLIKNGTTLTEGNFSPTFDIMANNKLYLTTIQQDLVPSSGTADSYQLLIWISEACTSSNITQCTSSQDQRDMLGETISGKVQIQLYTDSKKTLTRTTGSALSCPIKDKSGANSPKLVDGLIPVMYNGSNWVKANITDSSSEYRWYNYREKQWANAVLVSSTNRTTYMNANAGTVIPESDVLAYYVWIPRYKYKVWNINKVIGKYNEGNYDAYHNGIDIVFEKGTESTGTISCTYDFSVTATDSVRNEICTGSNGDYYTHPAFWWDMDGDTVHDDGEELEGIWVGKFEISSSTPDAQTSGNYYGGGTVNNLTVRIKPNVRSWRYNITTNFYKVIYDMQTTNNIYGLNTSRNNTDSHMMKNIEWGAVAYLTNSKYGRCSNDLCTNVSINDNSNFYTGGNNYVVNLNQTTTENIFGIYDMNGCAGEWLMGNMSSAVGSYTYNVGDAGSYFNYNSSSTKYIDRYSYGTTSHDQISANRSRLGDILGETVLNTDANANAWYGATQNFVNSTNQWFAMGGTYTKGTTAGVFFAGWLSGGVSSGGSSRAVLIGLQ